MKMNKNLIKTTCFTLVIFICAQLNAQTKSENSYNINPELQKNFVIVENFHNYNLNPHTANYSAEAQLLTGLYEGLFTYDPITLDPNYAIAKSYRISRDKKRWTFTLRDDVKFSDGVKISAEEVKNSWIRLLANPQAPYSSLFDIVKGAKAFRTGKGKAEDVGIFVIDDFNISVHLEQPASHLPKLLCMPCFSICGTELSLYTGPFILSERTENYIILMGKD